jgi:phenylacetate-CoA ligase
LAEVARREQIDLRKNAVRALVVAGEPGGSIRAVRQQIEAAWNATVFDHCGATEVGPWGFADKDRRGIIVNEAEFIAEFTPIQNREGSSPALGDPLYELVLTTLGRAGAPVIRYRTGDLVHPIYRDGQETCAWVLLEGGVLGRVDDMIYVRGVNVYPSAVEQIVREFPEVDEYQLVVRKRGSLDQLTVEVEDRSANSTRIAERLKLRLGLNVDVVCVPLGSLPRSEFKARRFVDLRRIPESTA